MEGEGKPKILLQKLPTSTRIAPGRVLRGKGGQLPERLSRLGARRASAPELFLS